MRIQCRYCGPRDEIEFTWGGPADIRRPADPEQVSDADWEAYLFLRPNERGEQIERWCHTYGCGQWLLIRRHTLSHRLELVGAANPNDREPGV
jgi:sarcosine oxidase, subunit delta